MTDRTLRDVMLDVRKGYLILSDFFQRVAGLVNEVSGQLAKPPYRMRPVREESLHTYNPLILAEPEVWLPYASIMVWLDRRRARSGGKAKTWPDRFVALHLLLAPERVRERPSSGLPELDLLVFHSYKAKKSPSIDGLLDHLYYGTEFGEWGATLEEWQRHEVKERRDDECVFGYDLYRLPLDRIKKPEDVRDRVVRPLMTQYEQSGGGSKQRWSKNTLRKMLKKHKVRARSGKLRKSKDTSG